MFAAYFLMFCRITIAFLFTFSFSSKILALEDFEVAVRDFKLLPRHWNKTAALLFLGLEFSTAALVTIGSYLLPIGFLLAVVLLTVFSVALVIVMRRDTNVSCNCFGRTERHISYYDVVRNLLLVLCSLIGLYTLRYASQVLARDEIILLALMSIVFVVFVTNLDDVVETLHHPFSVNEGGRK